MMVTSIRNLEQAIGRAIKEPSLSETKNIAIARKSIHLKVDKNKGEKIQEHDLEMLRPGDGISPMKFRTIIGRELRHDLPAGHKLSFTDLV